jgi:hypothetical protein
VCEETASHLRTRWALASFAVYLNPAKPGLVPTVVYTYPFWGANTFVDRELFSNDAPGVIVTQIDAGSPVESAGDAPARSRHQTVAVVLPQDVVSAGVPERPPTLTSMVPHPASHGAARRATPS